MVKYQILFGFLGAFSDVFRGFLEIPLHANQVVLETLERTQ